MVTSLVSGVFDENRGRLRRSNSASPLEATVHADGALSAGSPHFRSQGNVDAQHRH